MKQYKFTVVVRSPLDIKDIVWAFTHKLKDAFPIVSISFDEVSDRPTNTEHHGGVTEDEVLKEFNKLIIIYYILKVTFNEVIDILLSNSI